jgi:hypothetical protein
MRWRVELAKVAGFPPLDSMQGFGGERSWAPLKSDALYILLSHSDCDGCIPHKECARLADRLTELLPKLQGDGGGHLGDYARTTQRFIDGLRLAHEAGEDVDFH